MKKEGGGAGAVVRHRSRQGLGRSALAKIVLEGLEEFAKAMGRDRICDFQDNIDQIELQGFAGVTSVAQALGFATQVGRDVVFNFSASDALTVVGSTLAAPRDDLVIL